MSINEIIETILKHYDTLSPSDKTTLYEIYVRAKRKALQVQQKAAS
jgi:hypothetical protein